MWVALGACQGRDKCQRLRLELLLPTAAPAPARILLLHGSCSIPSPGNRVCPSSGRALLSRRCRVPRRETPTHKRWGREFISQVSVFSLHPAKHSVRAGSCILPGHGEVAGAWGRGQCQGMWHWMLVLWGCRARPCWEHWDGAGSWLWTPQGCWDFGHCSMSIGQPTCRSILGQAFPAPPGPGVVLGSLQVPAGATRSCLH